MGRITLTDLQLIPESSVKIPVNSGIPEMTGVSIDSRMICPGEIFFAIKGERFDGHSFLKDVIRLGVKAVVVSRQWTSLDSDFGKEVIIVSVPDTRKALAQLAFIHRNKYAIPIIGITGTNGKTTTKEMTAAVLGKKYSVVKSECNYNNQIGLPLTLFRLSGTVEAAVLEMGASFPGEIDILCGIAHPTYGVITNIGKAHLEFFKTQEEIYRTKTALLSFVECRGAGFINGDDPFLKKAKETFKDIYTFGLGNDADIRGDKLVMLKSGGYSFILNGGEQITMKVLGIKNVYNGLAAASVGLKLGVDEHSIADALESYTGYKQRMEFSEWRGIFVINDSYNANPDSMKAALEFLASYPVTGRRFAVLGDMLEIGESSRDEHSEVGKEAAKLNIDAVVTVGKESLYMTRSAREAGIMSARHCETHKEAAQLLSAELMPGDALLVKGSRGSTMEKVLEYLYSFGIKNGVQN